ncbi:PhzF family phenazine biosynthesis protein [Rugamonas apoptosis]|uniref:PhzF family phenazine biosynthesis protein n=1 Tax=Rugamonas apoptosis TaxID=2758570 RepID=A0A7W2ILP9_9BURK|nr:PhzF family phenazine biosynthesis protein [Rugamonas apoptosis]MBA5689025.1 PhzF family phenazine biosynthesis protein [Rugamonas apoptosis]
MKLPIYQVDAFTNEIFRGNYAAVIPLDQWLPKQLMQSIASENNVSETAFFVRNAEGAYEIRWFSPITEIDFCGHATLAAAYVIFRRDAADSITFAANSVGTLTVWHEADGRIKMRFPRRHSEPVTAVPQALLQGLSIPPKEVLVNQQAYVAIYESEQDIHALVSASDQLKTLGPRDVVVTAPGHQHDFVSRYFWPANGGDEDPVTGSIHAALAPIWAERLGKRELVALQASHRGGLLHCSVEADHVFVSGHAVQYLEGTIEVPVGD